MCVEESEDEWQSEIISKEREEWAWKKASESLCECRIGNEKLEGIKY